jgi:hypothetical protein
MAKTDYFDFLKNDIGALIDALELPDLNKHFLRSRWLDQVLYTEKRAIQTQKQYNTFRMTTIIGGVTIPALVSLNLSGTVANYMHWVTFAISLIVAVSSAVEGFFRFGDRWRHYRETAELQKIEGWQFFQLSGPYRRFNKHVDAYHLFASRVEEIIRRDVAVYVAQVTQERKEQDKPEEGKEKDEAK